MPCVAPAYESLEQCAICGDAVRSPAYESLEESTIRAMHGIALHLPAS